MTVAIVRESDGTPHIVHNVVREGDGTSHTVGPAVRANDASSNTIFATPPITLPTPSDRTFLATGTKRFVATP